SAVKRLWKPIVITTVLRCAVIPAVGLTLAYLLIPSLQGQHFAAYIALFGTPTAVSSAIMAKEMGGDGELADQLVVWTTIISAFTIFLEIVVLRSVGIF
ncbi:MAG: AEC family transporter, partial [Clostridia bacterium]|nr:AEC family transporter [Clostridia bacterium]